MKFLISFDWMTYLPSPLNSVKYYKFQCGSQITWSFHLCILREVLACSFYKYFINIHTPHTHICHLAKKMSFNATKFWCWWHIRSVNKSFLGYVILLLRVSNYNKILAKSTIYKYKVPILLSKGEIFEREYSCVYNSYPWEFHF